MPELPDITAYVDALRCHVVGQRLERIHIRGVSLLRSFDPPIESFEDDIVTAISRLGKRLVLEFENDRALVLHLMIAGRLLWRNEAIKPKGKIEIASFVFDNGSLILTEAGTKHRATLTAVGDKARLAAIGRGGIDILTCSPAEFATAMRRENRTLKRALTDPRIVDGVGNAYSDEILHAAQMSPFTRTRDLNDDQLDHLHASAKSLLEDWINRLRIEFDRGKRFPDRGAVTAFRPEFAVHGKFRKPCPVCNAPVQRVLYAENEMNYCARCQTEGRILADRALSRLLKDDWPKRIEDLDE